MIWRKTFTCVCTTLIELSHLKLLFSDFTIPISAKPCSKTSNRGTRMTMLFIRGETWKKFREWSAAG